MVAPEAHAFNYAAYAVILTGQGPDSPGRGARPTPERPFLCRHTPGLRAKQAPGDLQLPKNKKEPLGSVIQYIGAVLIYLSDTLYCDHQLSQTRLAYDP